jgi:hypothetical protein
LREDQPAGRPRIVCLQELDESGFESGPVELELLVEPADVFGSRHLRQQSRTLQIMVDGMHIGIALRDRIARMRTPDRYDGGAEDG